MEMEPGLVAIAVGACLAGGLVKGMIGLGLPLVAIPILSYVMPVPQSIAMLILPVVLSNIYQMVQGRHVGPVVRRLWPLLAALVAGMLLGAQFLVSMEDSALAIVLGLVILCLVLLSASRFEPRVPPEAERWVAPAVGFGSGVIGGFTSFYGPPLIVYMNALRMPKDVFVSALSTAYFVGSLPLALALVMHGVMGPKEAALSAAALLPVFAGMRVGQRVRDRIPQDAFRKAVLAALAAISLSLIWRGLSA
jgi:uncharacterized membrane protein YfcA